MTNQFGLLESYREHPKFLALTEPHADKFAAAQDAAARLAQKQRQILVTSTRLRGARLRLRMITIGGILGSVALVVLLFIALRRFWPIELLIGWLCLVGLRRHTRSRIVALARLKASVLDDSASLLAPLRVEADVAERRKAEAIQRIAREWGAYCVGFNGYPPDWDDRRRTARVRDGYACGLCGWPHGAQRRVRNLHVHHREPLSRGGNNSFENLVTLCHVCHRKQEGPGHKRIKYQKRRR